MQNTERRTKVFEKTDGYCHLCHRKLSFSNYGKRGTKGAWNIEHSKPKGKGGTDHLNNLFPACIVCNEDKGTMQTKTIRGYNGQTRAPLSKKAKEMIKKNNEDTGLVLGGGLGFLFGGPPGALLGGIIGRAIGSNNSPKK